MPPRYRDTEVISYSHHHHHHIQNIDVSHVPQLIQTNIPNNENKAANEMRLNNVSWIIMNVAPGISLQALNPPYSLSESIAFSINLLSIIKSIHAKGIVHRDLKPDNIHIKFSEDNSLGNAHITVLDFGLAYIEKHNGNKQVPIEDIDFEKVQEEEKQQQQQKIVLTTDFGGPMGNRWYRVPQLRSHGSANLSAIAKEKLIRIRRSPTIDTSSVCAILFWLLTKVVPKEEDNTTRKNKNKTTLSTTNESPLLYHQQEEEKLIEVVQKTAQETDRGMRDCDINRLIKYLLHTFDRGMADVDEQWLEDQWTVDQLLNHLNYMRSLLLSSSSPLSLQSRTATTFVDDFTAPISLFIKAKDYFLKKAPRCDWQGELKNYVWTNEWNERKHVDFLTHSKNGETWTILVTCSAKLTKIQQKQIMRLFVSSTVNDVEVQLPIYSYDMTESIDENKEMTFSRLFKEELHALISKFHGKMVYVVDDTETRTVSSQTDPDPDLRHFIKGTN